MRRSDENYPMRRDRGTAPARSDWSSDPFFAAGSPWQMMRRMQEDMDQLFGRFFGTSSGEGGQAITPGNQWAPTMDISSTEKEFCLEADLPGVKKDDIDITVQDHHLLLRAEMRQEQESGEGERQYHRRERRYGMFQRVIPLPENVDEENIRCDFRNGVLTVHIPRAAQAQQGARRIPVQDPEQIPSETATGRMRSRAELDMTEEPEEAHETAGAAR